jgi:hypothetical protein
LVEPRPGRYEHAIVQGVKPELLKSIQKFLRLLIRVSNGQSIKLPEEVKCTFPWTSDDAAVEQVDRPLEVGGDVRVVGDHQQIDNDFL